MTGEKKWIYLSYVAATLLLSWVLAQTLALVAGIARLDNPMLLGVVRASTVIAVVVVTVAAFFFFRREVVNLFAMDVLQEMKKVTWPVRKNVYLSTIVVIVCVVIVAVILGVYDWLCAQLISLVLRI